MSSGVIVLPTSGTTGTTSPPSPDRRPHTIRNPTTPPPRSGSSSPGATADQPRQSPGRRHTHVADRAEPEEVAPLRGRRPRYSPRRSLLPDTADRPANRLPTRTWPTTPMPLPGASPPACLNGTTHCPTASSRQGPLRYSRSSILAPRPTGVPSLRSAAPPRSTGISSLSLRSPLTPRSTLPSCWPPRQAHQRAPPTESDTDHEPDQPHRPAHRQPRTHRPQISECWWPPGVG